MLAHLAIAPAEFADRMDLLGPFEAGPHVAVACSGGPDSMALALLAKQWAQLAGGRVTALVVDHALRADSAEEAERVVKWLAEAGIEAVRLTWRGSKPTSDRQAAARRMRYHLMRRWCHKSGVLHLLVGHHRQDQAETFLLRLARGSGVDGLAAMAPLTETGDVRLLRPLLDIPRERLIAYLADAEQSYVRDPSNEDRAFARVRMRSALAILEAEGLTAERLVATVCRMARARAALEAMATGLLARAVAVYPEGYATINPACFREASDEVGLRALSRLLACIGGGRYGPRMEHLERLYGWLVDEQRAGAGRTLAGCRIVRRGAQVLVCREAKAIQDAVAAQDGVVWDGRFRLTAGGGVPKGLRIERLGRSGWDRVVEDRPALGKLALPALVRASLPALWALDDVVAVPHLNYRLDDGGAGGKAYEIAFLPVRPLSAAAPDRRMPGGVFDRADFRYPKGLGTVRPGRCGVGMNRQNKGFPN